MNKKSRITIYSTLFCIALSFFFIFLISNVSAGWFDNSWKNCSTITPTYWFTANYSHYLVLNSSVINYADLNADLGDLRFYDGTCLNANLTSGEDGYWIESVNSGGNSYVWLRTVNVNTTFAMYYTNTGATTHSNFSNAFLLGEDFNGATIDKNKWVNQTQGTGTMNLENGYLKCNSSNGLGGANKEGILSWMNFTGMGNLTFDIQRKANVIGESYDIGFYNYSVANDTYWIDAGGTELYKNLTSIYTSGPISQGGEPNTQGGVKYPGPLWSGQMTGNDNVYNANVWQNWSLRVMNNNNISFYLNGLVNATITTAGPLTTSPLTDWRFGFQTNPNVPVYLDFIRVRRFVSPSPSYSFGATEQNVITPSANVYINYPANTTTISSYLIQINSSANPTSFNMTNMSTFIYYRNGTFYNNISNFTINTNNNLNITHNFYLSYGNYSVLSQYCGYASDNQSNMFCANSSLINFQSNLSILFNSFSSTKSFRITEFIKVNGTNFTLGGNPYHIIGANWYYPVDYMTGTSWSDNGEQINNSDVQVYEGLNELQSINVNVIRTWMLTQGGNNNGTNATWGISPTGGHWNLAEKGYPGNYSETYFVALDNFTAENSKRDIRIQYVSLNQWKAYGGKQWYLSMSSTSNKTYENATYLSDQWWQWSDQFYTDPDANTFFRNSLNYTLNRNNTITGILYKDDPTIFSIMLINEPRLGADGFAQNHTVIAQWCNDTIAYAKTIDTKHLFTCGSEALGFNESWGEGSDIVSVYNNTLADYVTFAANTAQWIYMVEKVEVWNDNQFMCAYDTSSCNIGNDNVRNFWGGGEGYTYNSRDYSGDPHWIPKLPRHNYTSWTDQNVKWANAMNKPVMLQELVVQQTYSDVTKTDLYTKMINSFYTAGGDGAMIWQYLTDAYNRPSSTSDSGNQDDGFGFYVTDNATLKAQSVSTIAAFNYTVANNYVTLLNNYKYDFTFNLFLSPVSNLQNCSLFLNVSNATAYTGVNLNLTNTSEVLNGIDYTFTQQFSPPQKELYWWVTCFDDVTSYSTTPEKITLQDDMPVITLISPNNNVFLNYSPTLIYNVTDSLDISNMKLYINNVLNQTNSVVSRDTIQNFTTNFLSSGVYNWSLIGTDIGNNIGYSSYGNFTIDLDYPLINIVYPVNQSNFTKTNIQVNLTTSDANIQSVWWTNDVGLNNNTLSGGANISYTANQGWNNIVGYANDSAGNINSSNVAFFVDSIYPSMDYNALTLSNNLNVSQSNIYINVTWTEANFKNITFKENNNEVTFTIPTDGYNFTGLPDAVYYFNVTLCDILNQCSNTSTRRIVLDTTLPNVTLVNPGNNSYINYTDVNFTAHLNDSFTGIKNVTLNIYKTDGTNGLCYQETANISTACGGLATGNYRNDTWRYPLTISNLYDGDWATANQAPLVDGVNASLWINYTKPFGATGATWQVSGCTGAIINLTIPSDCFNLYSNTISLLAISESHTNRLTDTKAYLCYNGSWETIFHIPSTADCTAQIFEEGVYWQTTTMVNQTTITLTGELNKVIGIVVTLVDNFYTWFYDLFDFAGNHFISSNYTTTIDTIYPLIDYGIGTANDGSNLSQSNIYINTTKTEINFANITFRYNNIEYTSTSNLTIDHNFTSLADGVYYFNVTLCDLANNCNQTKTRKITLDTTFPSISITYPSPTNYLVSPNELNYTVSDINLNNCWWSNLTNNYTITCGDNITSLQALNGTNTWIVYANDTASHVSSSSVTFSYLTLGVTNNLSSPLNQNFTSIQSSINFNYTIYPINLNLTNVTLFLYNFDTGTILNRTLTTLNTNNTINRITTLYNLSFGNYSWNAYSCGYQTDNSSYSLCAFANNATFKIVNQTLSNNLYTNRTAEIFNYISLKSNVSIGYGYNFAYCNFSIRNPNGNLLLINNQSASITNGIVESNQVYLNKSGTYYANLTCYNDNGNYSLQYLNISVPDYYLTIPVSYSFAARERKNETNSFDIKYYDNTNGEVYFNLTVAIADKNNFSISLSQYSMLLNSTENSSVPFRIYVTLNASNQIANGTYPGNVTAYNSSHAIKSVYNFTYYISPPSGIPAVYANGSELCTDSALSGCFFSSSVNLPFGTSPPTTVSKSYIIKNVGGFTLTDCNGNFDRDLANATWISYSSYSFSLVVGESKSLTAYFTPNYPLSSGVTYSGSFYVNCSSSDIMGHPQTTINNATLNNWPVSVINILNPIRSDPGTSGGDSSPGSTSSSPAAEKYPTIGLVKPTGISKVYSELEMSIIFAMLFNSCEKKIGTIPLTDFSYCAFNNEDLENMVINLAGNSTNVSIEDMSLLYAYFKDNRIFQTFNTKEDVEKYKLILGSLPNPLIITPGRLDKNFMAHEYISYILRSNRELSSCEVTSPDKSLSCEVSTNTTIKVTYHLSHMDFFSQIFQGQISVTSTGDKPSDRETRYVDLVFRVINPNYSSGYTLFMPAWIAAIVYLSAGLALIVFSVKWWRRRLR